LAIELNQPYLLNVMLDKKPKQIAMVLHLADVFFDIMVEMLALLKLQKL
jgi:hypothetical protein